MKLLYFYPMNKKADIKGHFTKSTMTMTETQTTRQIEVSIPKKEADNVQAALLKVNHARGLYDDFFTLNQEFILYILSIGLKGKDWEVFMFLMAKMDYGNKILMNNQVIANALSMSKGQVSKAMTKLEDSKVVLKKKLYTARYEVSFNYDVLNFKLGFKGKASKDNIKNHKTLMNQEAPYEKRYNIEGNLDFVNGITGEVFKTIELGADEREKNKEELHKIIESQS